jgi:hypothetical protein
MPVPCRAGPLVLLTIACAVLGIARPARSEVHVAGQLNAVSVEARDASVEEVLTRLHQSFGVHHRSTVPLNRRITATYSGPLELVLRRLLEGYDFIVKMKADEIQVVIVGFVRPGGAEPGFMQPVAEPPRRRRAE